MIIMQYYIMYEDRCTVNCELKMVHFDSAVGVEHFLEEKINDHNYKADEFTVLYGKVLTPKIILQKTRVIVNPPK